VKPRIAIVAGEASGDLLGARLITALRDRFPDARFEGVAGPHMLKAGCEALFRSEELAVMGLVEILKDLPRLMSVRRELRQRWVENPPDCLVGIDSPDFNLRLERSLRDNRTPTVHYVSPSVWAWRPGRVETVARSADLLLCLFPFEPACYDNTGVTAAYVGHPLADEIPLETDSAAARAELGLDPHRSLVALLPGSRMSEVQRLGPLFAQTARRLAEARPEMRFVAPMAQLGIRELFCRQLARWAPGVSVTLVDHRSREAMAASDAVLLASGTASLEAMLLDRPMVVAYRLAPLTHFIVKGLGLLRLDRYALPNLLAGRDLVPEYMQREARPERLSSAVLEMLDSPPERRSELSRVFRDLHLELRLDSSRRAADEIARLLASPRRHQPHHE
jgi:lipid-A-disaccharide synthase